MSDFIIVDGDMTQFIVAFGAAIVLAPPGQITGSGPASASGKKICIDGDEASVEVQNCIYMTAQYVISGMGTVKIDGLGDDQLTEKSTVDGTKIILKGSVFDAVLEVQTPAQQITAAGTVPDSTTKYSGKGMFINSNMTLTGA